MAKTETMVLTWTTDRVENDDATVTYWLVVNSGNNEYRLKIAANHYVALNKILANG